jgi:hypothetical protein
MTFWVDEETENFPPEGTSENPVEPTRCLAQPGKSKAPKTRAATKVRMTSSRIRHPFQVNSQLVTCRGLFKSTDAPDNTPPGAASDRAERQTNLPPAQRKPVQK